MVRKGKWIQGATPSSPVSQAAREALSARLRAVSYYLPLAAFKSDRDVEYVHQLRVSTRRAMAAVRIFEELLPTRKAPWLKRRLKKIRRTAGDARDFDVLGQRISRWVEVRPSPQRTALLARVEQLRDESQKPIRKVERNLRRRDFVDRAERLVRRVRWRGAGPEPTFAKAAADGLRAAADPFFAAAHVDPCELESLHRFRIAGKHLRYSMELFAGAFESEFRTSLYPAVEEVQARLGEVNDHATAIERFDQWLAQWDDPQLCSAVEELLSAEREALRDARESFARWWTAERAAELWRRFDQLFGQGPARGERSA